MHLSSQKVSRISVRELTLFAVLGAVMFLTKFIMQILPNIHLLALFIAAFTLTYRVRALIPIYVYVLIDGIYQGFSVWWIPYLYIWLPLWAAFMCFSKSKLPQKVKFPLYIILCGLHGLSFGAMYAPVHALMFRLNFKAMIAWIIAGLPFDVTHAIGSAASATLIIPLTLLLRKLERGQW